MKKFLRTCFKIQSFGLIGIISFIAFSQASQASLISCEKYIEIEMNTKVLEKGRKVVQVSESLDFENYSIYDVQVAIVLDPGTMGVPYSAEYKVLTEDLPNGNCIIIDTKLESEVW